MISRRKGNFTIGDDIYGEKLNELGVRELFTNAGEFAEIMSSSE